VLRAASRDMTAPSVALTSITPTATRWICAAGQLRKMGESHQRTTSGGCHRTDSSANGGRGTAATGSSSSSTASLLEALCRASSSEDTPSREKDSWRCECGPTGTGAVSAARKAGRERENSLRWMARITAEVRRSA
jgi:hypothetical protein